jgi:hypothetical protein
MYARPLFVVVGIFGPVWPLFSLFISFGSLLGINRGCGYTLPS